MRLIIASFILAFVVAAATSCDDNDSVASSGYGIRIETAEVMAIASDNALSGVCYDTRKYGLRSVPTIHDTCLFG